MCDILENYKKKIKIALLVYRTFPNIFTGNASGSNTEESEARFSGYGFRQKSFPRAWYIVKVK